VFGLYVHNSHAHKPIGVVRNFGCSCYNAVVNYVIVQVCRLYKKTRNCTIHLSSESASISRHSQSFAHASILNAIPCASYDESRRHRIIRYNTIGLNLTQSSKTEGHLKANAQRKTTQLNWKSPLLSSVFRRALVFSLPRRFSHVNKLESSHKTNLPFG